MPWGGGDYGSPLQVAVAGVNSAEMVKLLVDAGADNTVPGGEYGLVLQTAIQMGDTANIWLLLKAGADVNAQGGKYGNVLQTAVVAYSGSPKLLEILHVAGADVNVKEEDIMGPPCNRRQSMEMQKW